MKWKNKEDEELFNSLDIAAIYQKKTGRMLNIVAFERLRFWLKWIDDACQRMGLPEIVVTSFGRFEDEDSYHSRLQAGDFRVKDRNSVFKMAWKKIFQEGIQLLDPEVQLWHHPELVGKPQEHYHLEIDTNSIVRNGNH